MVAKVQHGELVFMTTKPIRGAFNTWKKEARKKLNKAKEDGMTVVVEDPRGLFPEFQSFSMAAVDPSEGRTYQHIALDSYMQLAAMGDMTTVKRGNASFNLIGALVFSSHCVGAAIRPNQDSVNVSFDDKGRPKYDIEDALTGTQRCIMLIILISQGFAQWDEAFAKALFHEVDALYFEQDGYTAGVPNALSSLMDRTEGVMDSAKLREGDYYLG